MAKKEPQEGEIARLILANGGEAAQPDGEYIVVKVLDRHSVKVRPRFGNPEDTINVHKSRIEIIPGNKQTTDTQKKEEEMDTVATPEAPAKVAKKTTAPKQQKAKKKETPLVAFDINQWVAEHGGVHLRKICHFDHQTHQLEAHVAIDETAGYYHTINVYTYPDGTRSLGKKQTASNKFPLKGKRVTKAVMVKKTGQEEKRILKGTETAGQLVARYLANDYKKLKGEVDMSTAEKKSKKAKPKKEKEKADTPKEAPQA